MYFAAATHLSATSAITAQYGMTVFLTKPALTRHDIWVWESEDPKHIKTSSHEMMSPRFVLESQHPFNFLFS
jgi:hypothetical protein